MNEDLIARAELTRCLNIFRQRLQAGAIRIAPHLRDQVLSNIANIRFDAAGLIIESTVDPAFRSLVLSLTHFAEKERRQEMAESAASADPVVLQRTLFNLLADFFSSVAGASYAAFGKWEDALAHLKANASSASKRATQITTARTALTTYYDANATLLYNVAKRLAGVRLVLGGSSAFSGTQLASVKSMLLYSDAVLIPDPVYPWIEVPRTEERFGTVKELLYMWHLLQLKPLVDADLPYQALFVFPSFERSLEAGDPVTQVRIRQLVAHSFNAKTAMKFASFEELASFGKSNPSKLLQLVGEHQLFIAPGQSLQGYDLRTHIDLYRKEIDTWRKGDDADAAKRAPDATLVLLGMVERIGPQVHLLENAEELEAHPLMALAAHWHYYKLCNSAFETTLKERGWLRQDVSVIVDALNQPQFRWLGNVPIPDLVQLRVENENETFRRKVDSLVNELHSATLADLEKTVREFARGLGAMLVEHQKRVGDLEQKYSKKHKGTAAFAIATSAATFLPALAPFLGFAVGTAGAVALAGKYGKEKLEELEERKQLSKSLLGVLAEAKKL